MWQSRGFHVGSISVILAGRFVSDFFVANVDLFWSTMGNI